MRLLIYPLAFALIVNSALASTQQQIGSFTVLIDKDKFGDGSRVIAAVGADENGLILRCLQGTKNVAIYFSGDDDRSWSDGTSGDIKVKVDEKPVEIFKIDVVNGKLLQLRDSDPLIDEMRNSKEIAVRLTINDVTSDYEFQYEQVNRVIDEINKGCNK